MVSFVHFYSLFNLFIHSLCLSVQPFYFLSIAHVCMFMSMWTCTCICMGLCICMYIGMHLCMSTSLCVCRCVNASIILSRSLLFPSDLNLSPMACWLRCNLRDLWPFQSFKRNSLLTCTLALPSVYSLLTHPSCISRDVCDKRRFKRHVLD